MIYIHQAKETTTKDQARRRWTDEFIITIRIIIFQRPHDVEDVEGLNLGTRMTKPDICAPSNGMAQASGSTRVGNSPRFFHPKVVTWYFRSVQEGQRISPDLKRDSGCRSAWPGGTDFEAGSGSTGDRARPGASRTTGRPAIESAHVAIRSAWKLLFVMIIVHCRHSVDMQMEICQVDETLENFNNSGPSGHEEKDQANRCISGAAHAAPRTSADRGVSGS